MADIPISDIEDLLKKIREQYESLKSSKKTDFDDQYPNIPPTLLNEELRFCKDGSMVPFLGRGWGKPEESWIWSTDRECELVLNLPQVQNDLLVIFKGAYFSPGDLKGTPIDLFLNDKLIASWDENNNSSLSTLILKDQLSGSGKARLVFQFKNPRSPASLNLSDDSRLLGFSFKTMYIKEIV
jgi:hypothetical protein